MAQNGYKVDQKYRPLSLKPELHPALKEPEAAPPRVAPRSTSVAVHAGSYSSKEFPIGPDFLMGPLRGGGSKWEGFLRQLGERRGALGKTKGVFGSLNLPTPFGPPSFKDSITFV